MEHQRDPVAILGIGAMGRGMAISALRHGIPTAVWNRNEGPARELAAVGAEAFRSASGAVAGAAVVVTMVTDADAVIAVLRDEGVLPALAPNTVLVQMSTIGVEGIERVAALVAHERPDVTLLDAPVSGSKDPAEHGQLVIFASGPQAARTRVAPLFDALGQRTMWVGDVGTGTRLKLVANTWLAFAAEAVVAAVALARWLGLEAETVLDALEGNSLVSPWQEAKLHRIAGGEFSPQFALSLALKDVRLAEAAAGDRLAALVCLANEWQEAVDRGHGHQDVTAVVRSLASE